MKYSQANSLVHTKMLYFLQAVTISNLSVFFLTVIGYMISGKHLIIDQNFF